MSVIMYELIWIFCLFITTPVNSEYFNVSLGPHNQISNPCTDKNHLFLAPGVLTAGGTNRACISRFYPEGAAHLHITLVTEDRESVTTSRELPAGDGGCLDISVPLLPNTKAELIVNLRYPEAQCTWERRLAVRISSGRVLLVHTERARYRPGETLRFRVMAFKADLMPSHGMIDEIWIEGSRGAWEGSRITQWSRVRTRLGIAQLQYELDELAPPGKWTVRASLADGSQGAATFWVGNYDLPPFQLSVRHPAKVLRTSERLVWTVCVRYPWSEAVAGMLVMRLRGGGGGGGGGGGAGVRTAVRLGARACVRHAAAARRLGLAGRNPPDLIIADFSFQEDGTRIWQNTTVVSRVVDKAVSLEFLTKHRAVISPGLPHKLKVKATRWDDKPAMQKILVCRYPAASEQSRRSQPQDSTNVSCATADTDDAGVARVMFPPGNYYTPFYRFEASLSNDTSTTAIPLTLPVQRTGIVHAALGPLKVDPHVARTFVPLYLHLENVTTAVTVHFVVITRGGVIYRWGATTQCPIANSANQVQTAPRYSKCSQELAQTIASNSTQESDSLLDRHQLRVMLPIKVTPQMCPDSDLVAYFYYKGELVSASKHIEMEECFVNKVEAVWLSRQVLPGSQASLQVSTPGPSLCALTVVDSAAKWTHPPQNVQDELMKSLRRVIDSHRNLTEYDAAGDCFLSVDSNDPPSSSEEMLSSWLASTGVRILGGEVPALRHCAPPPHPLISADGIVPRSDFSEAWLWRLVAVGANGSAVAAARAPDSISRFEAGVLCVSKNGVAVAQPAVLQVFREMFIHADVPRRLRRGDSTILRYRLFNYLYQPLSVQVLILTDQYIETPAQKVESVCVAARASIARRIEIKARLPGKARLNIRAVVIKDELCGSGNARNVSDEVSIQITIDPEGVPVKEHKSIMLCAPGSKEYHKSEVSWTWPAVSTVPGTETLTVWTSSDAVGPLYADADSLVMLPRGCGEQNMARLATNLLALKLLPPASSAALTAREHVARGFTRQLQYVHPAGGFSAFGSSDAVPSTWLTAFVVRYLRRAHQALWPNLPLPPSVDRAERWLINQQMENGCFRNEGHVFHTELKGGLSEAGEIASVALTAYVITSLVESASPLPYRVLKNSLSCLRALPPMKTKNPNRVYAHALLAYAFIRLKRYEEELRRSNEASVFDMRRSVGGLEKDEELRQVMELVKMAKRSGDYVWWETSSLSTTVEATSYALLSLLQSEVVPHEVAAAAVAWLAAQRTDTGGFISTQDTLVALEALTTWSSQQPKNTNLTVTAYSNGVRRNARLSEGSRVPHIIRMGGADKLHVAVEGAGCAVVQATRAYRTARGGAGGAGGALAAHVRVDTDGTFHCSHNNTFCFCAAIVQTCVVWTNSFPEMALLEVSLPGGYGADAALLYAQLHKPNTLLRRIELTSNSGKAMLYLGTKDGSSIGAGPAGHQCFTIHAVGPNLRTKPAYVRVQDYYRPAVNDTQIYTIPEDCPAKIVHETNEYTASDNLFTKAKSLTDSSEILITHDFSYEDIPEGIPLDDPLYENLTMREKEEHNVDDVVNTVKSTVKSIQDSVVYKSLKDKLRKENTDSHEVINADLNDDLKNDEVNEGNDKANLIRTDTSNTTLNDDQVTSNDKEILTVKETETKLKHSIKTRDEHDEQNRRVENPKLTDFHVIDSEKDLEVPSGVEGPVPAVVLPPQNFMPIIEPQRPVSRMFHGYYPGMYYMPLNYNYGSRRYINSAG